MRAASASACACSTRRTAASSSPISAALEAEGHRGRRPLRSRGRSRAAGFELAPGNRLDLDVTFRPSETTALPGRRPVRPARAEPARRPSWSTDDGPASALRLARPRARVPAWAGALATPVDGEFRLNARAGGRARDRVDAQRASRSRATSTRRAGAHARPRALRAASASSTSRRGCTRCTCTASFFRLLARDGEPRRRAVLPRHRAGPPARDHRRRPGAARSRATG